jgi:hypothetical protein
MRRISRILTPQSARAGRLSGRTVKVLAVSLALALAAMVILLVYFYSAYSPQVVTPSN